MQSLCLMISRFALTVWIGAASLFVVTSVQETMSEHFDTVTKSALAVLRFPSYYAFGFTLLAMSLVCGLVARNFRAVGRWRMCGYLLLVGLALLLMLIDYFGIYQPLATILAATTEARPSSFESYHKASKYINAVDFGLCLFAALMISWPESKRPV